MLGVVGFLIVVLLQIYEENQAISQ